MQFHFIDGHQQSNISYKIKNANYYHDT